MPNQHICFIYINSILIINKDKIFIERKDNMNFVTYLLIFISKIIENALATLRLIVVANGKKILGAVLQFCIALVWCS